MIDLGLARYRARRWWTRTWPTIPALAWTVETWDRAVHPIARAACRLDLVSHRGRHCRGHRDCWGAPRRHRGR